MDNKYVKYQDCFEFYSSYINILYSSLSIVNYNISIFVLACELFVFYAKWLYKDKPCKKSSQFH